MSCDGEDDMAAAIRMSLEIQREEEEFQRVMQLSAGLASQEDVSAQPCEDCSASVEPEPDAVPEEHICDSCGQIKSEGQSGYGDAVYSEQWYCIDCWGAWRPENYLEELERRAADERTAADATRQISESEPEAEAEASPEALPGSVSLEATPCQEMPVRDTADGAAESPEAPVAQVPACKSPDRSVLISEEVDQEVDGAGSGEPVGVESSDTRAAAAADLEMRDPADLRRARMQGVHRNFRQWLREQEVRRGLSLIPSAAQADDLSELTPIQAMLMSVNRTASSETRDRSAWRAAAADADDDLDDLYEDSETAAALASSVPSLAGRHAAWNSAWHSHASSSWEGGVESADDHALSQEEILQAQAFRDATIAASLERQQLLEQQDAEYEESLRIDREKQATMQREEEAEGERQSRIRELEEQRHQREEHERGEWRRCRSEDEGAPAAASAASSHPAVDAAGGASPATSQEGCGEQSASERRAHQRELARRAAEARILGPSWITSSLPNSGAPDVQEPARDPGACSESTSCRGRPSGTKGLSAHDAPEDLDADVRAVPSFDELMAELNAQLQDCGTVTGDSSAETAADGAGTAETTSTPAAGATGAVASADAPVAKHFFIGDEDAVTEVADEEDAAADMELEQEFVDMHHKEHELEQVRAMLCERDKELAMLREELRKSKEAGAAFAQNADTVSGTVQAPEESPSLSEAFRELDTGDASTDDESSCDSCPALVEAAMPKLEETRSGAPSSTGCSLPHSQPTACIMEPTPKMEEDLDKMSREDLVTLVKALQASSCKGAEDEKALHAGGCRVDEAEAAPACPPPTVMEDEAKHGSKELDAGEESLPSYAELMAELSDDVQGAEAVPADASSHIDSTQCSAAVQSQHAPCDTAGVL